LNENELSDTDIVPLAAALKTSTNLKQLILFDNDITLEGEKTVLKAMFDPTSMDSIIKSNHTCFPSFRYIKSNADINHRPLLERELITINDGTYSIGVPELAIDHGKGYNIGQKIRMKVVLALCRQDGELFDLSHFNDLPLQLMPRVLALIQEHTIYRAAEHMFNGRQLEKDALSRLFHTLRGWELPLLFENLSGSSAKGGGKKRKRKTRH